MCFNHWTISFSLKSSKFICLYSTLYVFTNSSNGLSRPKFIFQNMFGIHSCRNSSADNVEFSYESSNSLNSTFAGITLSWIDDYWLMKCLTAESIERLIPILGVIGSIPKVASMKTKKVTLATGFLQSLLARVWFVFWFQTSTKQTYESILMWLFLILEIWWWKTWLFCFCWLWESKVLNLTKMLSMQAQRLNYCNSTRHCQSLLRSRTKYFT